MSKYLLTFKIDIEAIDDPAAREMALFIASNMSSVAPRSVIKLQRIFKDKPPISVALPGFEWSEAEIVT